MKSEQQKENPGRRTFIKNSLMVSVGFMGLRYFTGTSAFAGNNSSLYSKYGPLLDDPQGIFNLPKGFSYKIISRSGELMDDGFLSPGRNDAMAAFSGKSGKVIVIRNHEISSDDLENGPFGIDNSKLQQLSESEIYDRGYGKNPSLGGTTTFVFNEDTQEIEYQYLSLAGTIRNCAGGPTPWGSWLTCEETFDSKLEGVNEHNHGYVFEVPVSGTSMRAEPFPLKAMGRFNHEAVAVDPDSGLVYLTEDRGDGLIYRFIPNEPGNLRAGGKLQALSIKGQKGFDTRNWEAQTIKTGKPLEVDWIDLENADPEEDDLRLRGFAQGAARFARGEGMWYGNDEVYFACTNGGKEKQGQVFRYIPSADEKKGDQAGGGLLELFSEPNDKEILRACDNLTVAPWGDLVLCEDDKHPRLIGITSKGEIYHLGLNVGYESELAGACFSPSGKTLFLNIQHVGLTLAITGPWQG
ncbi:alkaline phosphatase PhoX [Algoriphagus sp.]|uniref:alkaline phosphatase PhoX n=1 Tax=Algoriphagus sp. TaxID=1872435 RepID=UPI003F6F6BA9